jgi:type I restriction enzyme S subunit
MEAAKVCSLGQIYTHYGTYADRTKTFVSEEFFKKARKAQAGDLVIHNQ